MNYAYAVTPVAAWLAAGATKFVVNSIRTRRLAFDLVGNGGMPSTHSAVVSAAATTIALLAGSDSPAFCIALALSMVVAFDATGVRRQVGHHAARLNQLRGANDAALRERVGHQLAEILAGLVLGAAVAALTVRLMQ